VNMYCDLTPEEEAEFRQYMRDAYTPGAKINPVWHPVCRDECERMNQESIALRPNMTPDEYTEAVGPISDLAEWPYDAILENRRIFVANGFTKRVEELDAELVRRQSEN
jgi:hypothetical protein